MATLPSPKASFLGRRERRRLELRERVVDATLELVADQGFEATTVEQIATAADIAPATFFNHFQSKSGLLAEITAAVATAIEALVEENLGADRSVREQLEGLAEQASSMITDHQKVAREVMLEMLRAGARPEDAAPYFESLRRPLTARILEGQLQGEVRTDQEAEFLAEMVLGAFHATVTQWLSDESYPIAERLRRAASFIWGAIRTGEPVAAPRRSK